MKIIKLTETSTKLVIDQAVQVLQAGGLVIFPTETTYGAGVDATNYEAVNKLLAYKTRREGKPLSIAVPDQETAQKYVEINDQAQKLYDRFLPGPVTIISQSKHLLAPGVESEFGTLGVRIPDYLLILKLLKKYGRPITATSANVAGRKNPYTVQDILDQLSGKQKKLIDLVLDAGQLPARPPSTVIDTTLSTPTVYRNGATHRPSTNKLHPVKFISQSESETKKIAGKLCLQHWDRIKSQGLVIGLNGSLGAGKTIFAKGVAEFFQISRTITSPTYSYIEEYRYDRHGWRGQFFHLDVWKVNTQEELERLRIGDLIQPKNVVVIEWWKHVSQWSQNIEPNLIVNFEGNDFTQRTLKIISKV